ncbi:BgTH12-02284 [Blumeria graminis f. sp. triticale]|uniref:BgTH12-02284 n=1 Tax=Blumeria graminis f. sp. triticale TaxID=1689686 RepID=A0A9W4GER2_BLUGR|nr:BgTH12-02284 [Blumeria graminis f. sp. triticale]
MSYRVEVASSGRAGCQSTDCKKAGTKIAKDELRMGTWVDIPDRGGSWRWRHWGCVTGKVLLNIREALDPTGSGNYEWDLLDGYQGSEKNSLNHFPDLQAKVRRVISQGFIDYEDFNGDPEMNRLGSTGLRAPATKKKAAKNKKDMSPDITALKEQINSLAAEREKLLSKGLSPSKIDIQLQIVHEAISSSDMNESLQKKSKTAIKPPTKKRGRKKKDEDEDEDEGLDVEENIEVPVKKKRVSAKDKKILAEQKVEEAKPLGKKSIKQEDDDTEELVHTTNQEIKPAQVKKARTKRAIKKEVGPDNLNEKPENFATTRNDRAKRVIKKEEDEDMIQTPEGNDLTTGGKLSTGRTDDSDCDDKVSKPTVLKRKTTARKTKK